MLSCLLLGLLLALPGGGDWRSYTSTNYINDIVGSDTLLTVATRGGVYELDIRLDSTRNRMRSDTNGFRVLRTITNSDGLPANICNALAIDPEGNIWVGTDGGGLGVILRDSNRALRYRPFDIPEVITGIARHGTRLLLGTNRGFYVIETFGTWLDFDDDIIRHFTVATRPELLSNRVFSVAVVGDYWVGTNIGITAVDTSLTAWRSWRRPLGDSVKAIAGWGDTVLAATESGVARLQDTAFVPVFRFDPPRRVFDLEPAQPTLYIATDTGVFTVQRLDSTTLRQLAGRECRTVYRGEGIWIGRGGIPDRGEGLRYNLTPSGWEWETFMAEGIFTAMVTGAAFSPVTGDLHACHYQSSRIVSTVKPETGAVELLSGALGLPLQIACDSRGRVWTAHFAHDGGLSRYDPVAEEWDTLQWGASSGWNIITAFGIDHNDTKWMFNADGVVVAIDSAGEQVAFEIPGLASPPGGGYDFATDRKGRAWLGLTVGLVMIDYGGTLHDRSDDRYAVLTEGLPSREVRSVAVDADDNVWAATSQGVAVYDGNGFRVYTTRNSDLLSDDVYRIRCDRAGRVWILTDAGLSVYDPVFRRWSGYTPQNSGVIPNLDGVTGFYTSLDIDQARNRVAIGTLQGLSVLSLRPDTTPSPEADLRVYPNPCILGLHNEVIIDSLPENTRVEIRTASGRLVAETTVREGRREAIWRPDNVASGIYLLVVQEPTGTRVTRVAVIRP